MTSIAYAGPSPLLAAVETVSSGTTYVGVKPTDVAVPSSRFRLALRRRINFLEVGKEILTLGTAATGMDNWTVVMNRFVEKMPGSGVAFPTGNAVINEDAGTAVVDIRLMTTLPGVALSFGEVLRALEPYHVGAQVDKVTRLGAENLDEITAGRESELEGATERAQDDDLLSRLGRLLKNVGLGLAVVVIVGLLIYAAVIRPRTAAA